MSDETAMEHADEIRLADPTVYLVFTIETPIRLKGEVETNSRVSSAADSSNTARAQLFTRLYSQAVPQPVVLPSSSLGVTEVIGQPGHAGVPSSIAEAFPTTLTQSLRLYPEGICVIRLFLTIAGLHTVDDLNWFVNESLAGSLLWRTTMDQVPVRCDSLLLRPYQTLTALAEGALSPMQSVKYLESFSIVEPRNLVPLFHDSYSYRDGVWERSLYAAAIRRIANFTEVDLSVPRSMQKNLSHYVGDLVYLNYHHLFVFVPRDRGHLPPSFYIDMTETVKALVALLYSFDVTTYLAIAKFEVVPSGIGALRRETELLESTRLDILRSLDTFRMLTAVSATRARWFLVAALDTFGVDALQKNLQDKLEEIEFVLSNRYNMSLQRTLQLLAIAIGVLSLLVTVVGVVVSVD